MYARVVRFTDIDPQRVEARAESGQGPPPGVDAKSVQWWSTTPSPPPW
jgi:hypothetical protein